ncbi:unnamed protein product [Linum trigynum]|uniref:Uncharacterized protein n=1 Tax=Linum trigynum TaxID=586398 RepID=A0AAV2CLQ9_9ROSI
MTTTAKVLELCASSTSAGSATKRSAKTLKKCTTPALEIPSTTASCSARNPLPSSSSSTTKVPLKAESGPPAKQSSVVLRLLQRCWTGKEFEA